MKSLHILVLLIAALSSTVCDGYRILFLAPFPVPSHWMWLDHFVREMLNRGHHVTALTCFMTKSPHANYTELIIDPPFDLYPISPPEWIFDGSYYNPLNNLKLLWRIGLPTTKHAFESDAGQKLLNDPSYEFDLVISEQFHQEAMLLFAHKFNAPLMTISTYDIFSYLDESKGFRTSLGTVPHVLLPLTENMSFKERLLNIGISYLDKIVRFLYYLPVQNGIARHFFKKESNAGNLPSVQEMEQKIAVSLFNIHPAMVNTRPRMPSHIMVGGVHLDLKKDTKLDESVKEFLDDAEEGVIYISFGTHIQTSKINERVLDAIVDNLRNIPQKVLWKVDGNHQFKNQPKNIKLVNWVSQTDVLAHPNVILFVNHGGIFGTQESCYYGVPMLTIPFYGDQFRNAKNVERNGHGLVENYLEITKESFGIKLRELLNEPEYRIRADEIATLFRDNPMKPMDVAMYWIEFVARHGGAPHLQSKALDVPFWKDANLDILAVAVVSFFVTTLAAFVTLNKLIGKKREKAAKRGKSKRN